VPTLLIEGGGDKLLPRGWAAEIAGPGMIADDLLNAIPQVMA